MLLLKDLKNATSNYPEEPPVTVEFDTKTQSASVCNNLIEGCHLLDKIQTDSNITWTMYTSLVMTWKRDEIVILAQFVSDQKFEDEAKLEHSSWKTLQRMWVLYTKNKTDVDGKTTTVISEVKKLEYNEALPENRVYIRPKEVGHGMVAFYGEVGKNFMLQTINIQSNYIPEFSFIYTVSSLLQFYTSPFWHKNYKESVLLALNNATGCLSTYKRFPQLYATTQTQLYQDINIINFRFQTLLSGHFKNTTETIQLKVKSNFHNPELNKPENYERQVTVGDRFQTINWMQPLFKGRFNNIIIEQDEGQTSINVKVIGMVEVLFEESDTIGKVLWASQTRLFSELGVFSCQSNGLFAKSLCDMTSKFADKLIDWGQAGTYFWTITKNEE